MTVYFIQATIGGPIKIGRGVVEERRDILQSHCPFELRVIAAIECGDDVQKERKLHRRFAGERLRGEWFIPSAKLCALVEELGGSVYPGIAWVPPNPATEAAREPATVAERVRALRNAAGMTQNALAAAAGITRGEVSKIEGGANKASSWKTMTGLSRAFRMDAEKLNAFLSGKLPFQDALSLIHFTATTEAS